MIGDINYSQPDLNIPEKDMTPEWYKQAVRYFSLSYNSKTNILDQSESQTHINSILEYYKYYLGIQDNVNYNHVTQDETGNTLQGVFLKGQKIPALIDYMHGVFQKSVQNIEVDAECISKDAYNTKTEKMRQSLFEYDMKPLFETMAGEGVEYAGQLQQLGIDAVDSKEDIYRHFEIDFKEQGELNCIDTANDVIFRNRFNELYPKVAMTCFITGIAGVHTYVENGKARQELIPSYNLIFDNSKDDDFNRKAQYAGIKRRLPITTVISQYYNELSTIPGAIKELKSLATKGYPDSFLTTYNTNTNFSWWYNQNGVPEVTIVTVYFVSSKDLKYEDTVDPYGNTYYSKVKKKTKSGQYYTNTIRKATLIGNKYLVDFGEETNQVRDHLNPSDTMLPIRIFMPNMYLGRNKSVVSRLANNQDRLDMLSYHLDQMIGRDIGKVYLINGNKLGRSTPKDLLQDLKTMGFHVTEGTNGEADDRLEQQRLVEVIDMTADPNIQLYVNLKKEEERIMEEIVNISKVALGQQTTYIGYGTQKNSIAQSSLGQSYLYDGLMQFLTENLQYSVDQQNIVWGLPEFQEQAMQVVGKRGTKWIQISDAQPFEKYLIKIKVQDQLDEAQKQRLTTMAQALAQNGLIDFLDVLTIESATSLVQLKEDIAYALKKKQRKAEEQQQVKQQLMAQQQQKDRFADLAKQELNNQGKVAANKQLGKNALVEKIAQGQIDSMLNQQEQEAPTEQ